MVAFVWWFLNNYGMNRLYFILFTTLLLSGCGNHKGKSILIDLSYEGINTVKAKLDSSLVKGVLELSEEKILLEFPDIPLNESFTAVCFEIDHEYAEVNFSDSIVNIYHNNDYDYYNVFISCDNCYKGILDIDGYNVAIFDFGGFGEKYYHADSLKQIPLDVFKPYPMKYIPTIMYYIENGVLNYWNP